MLPTLYGVNASPFVRKVRILAAEKQIEYHLEPVMPRFHPEGFLEISPLGKVPAWKEGDFAVSDSSAICMMLEKRAPDPSFYPEDARRLARALWLEEYSDTVATQAIAPTIFYNRVIKPKVMLRPSNEAVVQEAVAEKLPPVCDYVEGQLGDGEYLVGERCSIADVSLGSIFTNLWHAGVPVDDGRWPRLARFTARFRERPSVAAIIEEELKMFDGMPGLAGKP